jgi:hypothetical protein
MSSKPIENSLEQKEPRNHRSFKACSPATQVWSIESDNALALDINQDAERVTLSHGILSVFQSLRSTGFQSVITGDESCFLLYYPRDSVWASSRDKVPKKVSQKMAQKMSDFISLACQ